MQEPLMESLSASRCCCW